MQRGAAPQVESTSTQTTARPSAPVSPTRPGSSRQGSPGSNTPGSSRGKGLDPFDEVEWDVRSAVIGNEKGERRVRAARRRDPAVLVAAGDQHRRLQVFPRRHRHARARAQRQAAHRPRRRHHHGVGARKQKYFASEDDLQAFSDDLKHLLVYQKAAFNSPVWFNCGFEKAPQCSACFINSVQDTMESILGLAKTEGMLFKFGSGTGSNLSPIRSSRELLAGGGTASGPVSFMKGFDAFAGVIKSGGKTRRAAKMVILNADHPGHRRVHQLQGRGREEGVGADRRRLRRLVHRPGVCVRLLPELEQQRARDRRVHARGDGRRGVDDEGGA